MFNGCHSFVCGMTGTGKTTFVTNQLKKSRKGVFFFNPQGFPVKGFINMAGNYPKKDYIRLLKHGDKINYIPSANPLTAKTELNHMIMYLFEKRIALDFFFVIDEAHTVCQQGKQNDIVNMLPTRGRVFGYQGIFIAQRPALVDKTILTQCTRHFIFRTEAEQAYFQTKGFKFESIQSLLGRDSLGGRDIHNYVKYEQGRYEGPYKEKI